MNSDANFFGKFPDCVPKVWSSRSQWRHLAEGYKLFFSSFDLALQLILPSDPGVNQFFPGEMLETVG